MGFDDIAALVMLAAGGAQLRLVTTVHGVCASPLAAPLAQRLLAALNVSAPVVPGSDQSSAEAAELPSWVAKHRTKLEKASELLELPELSKELFNKLSEKLPDFQEPLASVLKNGDRGLTLLALGPVTNVAAAIQTNPSNFQEAVGKIIVAGDHTKANPFNFRLDPLAWDVVLNSGVPIHMVGTCCRPDAKQLEELLKDSLTHQMLVKVLEQHPLSLVQDPVTAAYFLAPEIFKMVQVEVQTSGSFRAPRNSIRGGGSDFQNGLPSSTELNFATSNCSLYPLFASRFLARLLHPLQLLKKIDRSSCLMLHSQHFQHKSLSIQVPPVQLTWNCWDVTTLLLLLLSGGCIAFISLSQLLSDFTLSSLGNLDWAVLVLALCIFLCLIVLLGAWRPSKGGKGFDFKHHDAKEMKEVLTASVEKIVKLVPAVGGAGSICFQIFADIMALINLFEQSDWFAFAAKLSMRILATSVTALWADKQTPSSLKYMPPLGLRARSTFWLPWCVAFLTLVQLLPLCLLFVYLLFFVVSYDAFELGRGLRAVCLPQILLALQRASLLTETVPGFLLNMVLLNGANLSPTSWMVLATSTFATGCSLVWTFAQLDERGHVSHFVISLAHKLQIVRHTFWGKSNFVAWLLFFLATVAALLTWQKHYRLRAVVRPNS
eukprot:Skav204558  [mRNA]  locus=scaffold2682:33023:35495:+ [translate_table: standard]